MISRLLVPEHYVSSYGKNFAMRDDEAAYNESTAQSLLEKEGYYVEGFSSRGLIKNYLMEMSNIKADLPTSIIEEQPDLSGLRKLQIDPVDVSNMRAKVSRLCRTHKHDLKFKDLNFLESRVEVTIDRLLDVEHISNFTDSLIFRVMCCKRGDVAYTILVLITWCFYDVMVLDLNVVIKLTKVVGEFFKLGGYDLSDTWNEYVEMNVMTGFFTKADDLQIEKDISAWVDKREERSEDWYNNFAYWTKDWIVKNRKRAISKDFVQLSFREWVSDRQRWATTGASSIDIVKEKGWNLRNKFGSSLLYSDEDLISMALDPSVPAECFVSQKPEKGKARIIVKADVKNYLLETYVLYYFYATFSPITTSLMQSGESAIDMYSSLSDVDGWNVPTDISEYDHVLDKRMVNIAYSAIYEAAVLNCEDKENLIRLIDVHNLRMNKMKIHYGVTGRVWEWENGLLSGVAATIIVGTMGSYAFHKMMQSYASIPDSNILSVYTQGDDSVSKFVYLSDVYKYLMSGRALNIPLNPRKFFISRKRTEFLRKIFVRGGSYGYGSRLLPNFMFRSPEKPFSVDSNSNEYSEIGATYREAMMRGFDLSYVKSKIINFTVRRTNMSRKIVTKLYSKSVFEGGMGLELFKIGALDLKHDGFRVDLKSRTFEEGEFIRHITEVEKQYFNVSSSGSKQREYREVGNKRFQDLPGSMDIISRLRGFSSEASDLFLKGIKTYMDRTNIDYELRVTEYTTINNSFKDLTVFDLHRMVVPSSDCYFRYDYKTFGSVFIDSLTTKEKIELLSERSGYFYQSKLSRMSSSFLRKWLSGDLKSFQNYIMCDSRVLNYFSKKYFDYCLNKMWKLDNYSLEKCEVMTQRWLDLHSAELAIWS